MENAADRDPWWTDWFGEEYLACYPNRDDVEARQHAASVSRRLFAAARVGRVPFLDLSCATGRHAVVLSGAGRLAGIDGSLSLLREARHREKVPAPGYLGGDQRRLPFRSASFGAAVNFFPSLGTWESCAEDERALREVRRVLAPGGVFLSSHLNGERALSALFTQQDKTVAGRRLSIRRRYRVDTGRLEKEISVCGGFGEKRFRQSVRVYALADLRRLFLEAGFEEPEPAGDFDGSPFRPLRSPRLVLLARRGAGA